MSDSIKPSTRRSGLNPEQGFQGGYQSKIAPIAEKSIEERCFRRIQGNSRLADRLTATGPHQAKTVPSTVTSQEKTDLSEIKAKAEQLCEKAQELAELIISHQLDQH